MHPDVLLISYDLFCFRYQYLQDKECRILENKTDNTSSELISFCIIKFKCEKIREPRKFRMVTCPKRCRNVRKLISKATRRSYHFKGKSFSYRIPVIEKDGKDKFVKLPITCHCRWIKI